MSHIIYINGQYVTHDDATLSIDDRGLQWGDSVYIVFACYHGRFIDSHKHFARLDYYAKAIGFSTPFSTKILDSICQELLQRNRLQDAAFYVQLTRGIAKRVHWFPTETKPSLIITARPFRFNLNHNHIESVAITTTPDIRWARSYIKTNAAIANVILRQQAREQGCFDCWLTDNQDYITESASSNAFIIRNDGVLQTRPDDGHIVAGVTRERILDLARQNNIVISEQPFTVHNALQAREAFITGATTFIKSVITINDQTINDGKPGSVTRQLSQYYSDFVRSY